MSYIVKHARLFIDIIINIIWHKFVHLEKTLLKTEEWWESALFGRLDILSEMDLLLSSSFSPVKPSIQDNGYDRRFSI